MGVLLYSLNCWFFYENSIPVDPYLAARGDLMEGQLIHAGDLGDDTTHCNDGLTFRIEDGKWGMTIRFEAV
jgi:hypothetical protein